MTPLNTQCFRCGNVLSATQAQKAILSSPFRAEGDHAFSVASTGTPIRRYPEPSALQLQLTPVRYRSRLSGAGASPTECLRDYLSGQQQGRRGGKDVRVRVVQRMGEENVGMFSPLWEGSEREYPLPGAYMINPFERSSIRTKFMDHVVLSPGGVVLVTSPGTESSNLPPQSLNNL